MSDWRPLTGEEISEGHICQSLECRGYNGVSSWSNGDIRICNRCHKDRTTKPMGKPTCGEPKCAYWDESGACRRRAPRWLNRRGEQFNSADNEPRVDSNYWCGEHPMFPKWIEQQKGE